MAYNYEYPYVDPYRVNNDWLLKQVKALSAFVRGWSGTTGLFVFDTFADMVNGFVTENGLAFIRGYYAPEDGGAGFWYYKAEGESNDFTQVKLADGGYAYLFYEHWLNLKAIGADNGNSIDDLLSFIETLSNIAIYCENGTYTVSIEHTFNKLYLDLHDTILQMTGNGRITLTNSTINGGIIQDIGRTSTTSTSASVGLISIGSGANSVKNCDIISIMTVNTPISWLQSAEGDNTIENCYFNGNGVANFGIWSAPTVTASGINKISQCTFTDFYRNGIYNSLRLIVEECEFNNCHLITNEGGGQIDCCKYSHDNNIPITEITTCKFINTSGTQSAQVESEGGYISVKNCSFYSSISYSPILLSVSPAVINIDNNVFNFSTATSYLIYCAAGWLNLSFTNNVVLGSSSGIGVVNYSSDLLAYGYTYFCNNSSEYGSLAQNAVSDNNLRLYDADGVNKCLYSFAGSSSAYTFTLSNYSAFLSDNEPAGSAHIYTITSTTEKGVMKLMWTGRNGWTLIENTGTLTTTAISGMQIQVNVPANVGAVYVFS